MNECIKDGIGVGFEANSEILCSFQVTQNMFTVVKMSLRGVRKIFRKDVGDDGDVRSCGHCKPLETSDDVLEVCC